MFAPTLRPLPPCVTTPFVEGSFGAKPAHCYEEEGLRVVVQPFLHGDIESWYISVSFNLYPKGGNPTYMSFETRGSAFTTFTGEDGLQNKINELVRFVSASQQALVNESLKGI